jgi:uncharacterized repeat protein (TIGR03803 family)
MPEAPAKCANSAIRASTYGSIFSIPVSGGPPTTLLSFNYGNGQYPQGSLTLSGSTLYGMASQGGSGYGTIFSIPVTGGPPTTLFSFDGTNGAYPFGSLTLSGSTLYGMTFGGGQNFNDNILFSGNGTVFALTIPEPSSVVLLSLGVIGQPFPHAFLHSILCACVECGRVVSRNSKLRNHGGL